MNAMNRREIDLNADLGEGCEWDAQLLDRVTSASIACGGHAGDENTMRATLMLAGMKGVIIGAHPGFPDRESFGRREQVVSGNQSQDMIVEQVQLLRKVASDAGQVVQFLKPHGALYNQAQRDPEVARGVVNAAHALGLPVLGLPAGCVETIAESRGVMFISEGFADRRYTAEGRLVSRSEPHAVLESSDEIAKQAISLVDRGLTTLCIHGDNPRSVEIADLVRKALRTAGVELRGFLAKCSA